MRYIFFGLCLFSCITLFGQTEKKEIEKQLTLFEQAHNNRNIDSMMLIVSNNYEETFLPDIVYDAQSLKSYYTSLLKNNTYKPIIDYNIQDIEGSDNSIISDVVWEYIIFPSRGSDTLYYARNKGVIQWEKEAGAWKMKKAFGGNLKEINNLNDYTSDKAIQTQLLDWISYYNNRDLNEVMALYDRNVKGLSAFNGSFILYEDLKKEYENLFASERLNVHYELDGIEALKFSDDLAYSITVWNYKVHDEHTDVIHEDKYRHLTVWEYKSGGQWKIISFVRKKMEY